MAIAAASLPRITQAPPAPAAADLADRAWEALRYRPLINQAERSKEVFRLTGLLLEAGVQPFEPSAVGRYMRQQVRKRWLKAWRNQALCAGLVVGAFYVGDLWIGVALLAGVVGSLVSWTVLNPANWHWRMYRIADYDKPIPESALALAIRLKKALPFEATFWVNAFEERSDDPIPRGDPFLVVQLGNAALSVAVWDEPDFKGEVA